MGQIAIRNWREYRFVVTLGVVALAITSIPYILGAALATEDRVFGGFVYALEDCYSYLAKMRQGAEGAWLFHIAYTPEPHPGTLYFPFHLLLGKVAALLPGGDLTARMVWVYHGVRMVFGLGLLLTVYRFLATFTTRVAVRRLAWLIVTFGGGMGWLLVALGQPNWLGSMPLDFILPEGFTFLILYAFPHIALGRTLLLWGILFVLRAWEERASHTAGLKWATLAGLMWLAMGLIVPFYVAVAWAVMGTAWVALGLRKKPACGQKPGLPAQWQAGLMAGVVVLISAPVVIYSAWVFTSDPVYETWGAQNRILSPHPLHYLAAYGVPLALAALAAPRAWREEGRGWFALAWVAVVPFLVYLPFNLQRRLTEGVQVPLSLLAALGVMQIANCRLQIANGRRQMAGSKWLTVLVLAVLVPTNGLLVAGNCLALRGQPVPIYRDAGEVAALDWLNKRVESNDVVLAAYETGTYLPARVGARTFVGHGPESVRAEEKKILVTRFFDAVTDETWRQELLTQYGVDYVFWGPAERRLGAFDPHTASYLQQVYQAERYAVFEVKQ